MSDNGPTPPPPPGPDRRLFLQTVSGGLIVTALAEPSTAPAAPTPLPSPQHPAQAPADAPVAAWLRLEPDGHVTALAGKVEIGQGVRTTLGQAVAEELGVPFDSVHVLLADTAQVPYDVGTFGSLSTPTVFARMRQAAATAREFLKRQAAQRWGVEPSSITVDPGRVAHPPSGRSLPWSDLLPNGQIHDPIPADIPLTPLSAWRIAGRSVPNPNGRLLVTGQHRYASDLKRPSMRHGKILRAPASGLTLKTITTNDAEQLRSTQIVRDGDFVGVIADTPADAEAAIKLLADTAEWDGTPPEGTDKSLSDLLVANQRPAPREGRGWISHGDVAAALAASSSTLEARYTAAAIAHVPLEPRACIAEWSDDGSLTLRTGTQVPFGVRGGVARHFGLPDDRVRLIVPDTGSGYGGKQSPELEIEAARLAKAAGTTPVRLAWTRPEEFIQGYSRPPAVIDVKAGLDDSGHLTAWSFHSINPGNAGLDTPYRVPARECALHQSTAPIRQGSYRALASTVHHFARESMMDELARLARLDPLEFRLRNLDDPRIREALTKAADRFGWSAPKQGQGRGLACGFEKGAAFATMAEIDIDPATRRVRVTRLLTAFAPGAVVNPDGLSNQIEGAAIQALGGALFEAVEFANGRLRNASLSRYRVPRFRDLPQLEALPIHHDDLPPSGAGECPLVCVAPALANAIHDATGSLRLRSMPLAPEGLPAEPE
jgi:isoquinoline 1-oxidoreductase